MSTRRLTLRKETLSELTPDDLRRVIGATGVTGVEIATTQYVTELLTYRTCASWHTEEC